MLELYLSKKNITRLATTASILVWMIGTMIYFRSADEEFAEKEADYVSPMWLFWVAIMAGLNEALEVYDHIILHDPSELGLNKSSSEPLTPYSKTMVLAGIALTPFFAASIIAHYLQGDDLAREFHSKDASNFKHQILALVLSLPALTKFLSMTLPHVFHTLNGTRERFSLEVTNNKVPRILHPSMPSFKWLLTLAVLIWVHLPEGRLHSSCIDDPFARLLATYGFAIAESLPHINQIEQLKNNLRLHKLELPTSKYFLMLLISLMSGVLHSSQTLLAVLATSENKSDLAGIGVEFVIGAAEGLQHAWPTLNKMGQKLSTLGIYGKNSYKNECPNDPLINAKQINKPCFK